MKVTCYGNNGTYHKQSNGFIVSHLKVESAEFFCCPAYDFGNRCRKDGTRFYPGFHMRILIGTVFCVVNSEKIYMIILLPNFALRVTDSMRCVNLTDISFHEIKRMLLNPDGKGDEVKPYISFIMKRYEYGLCAGMPALATSIVPFIVVVCMSLCWTEKGTALLRWIVSNAFSAIITRKMDNGLTRWFFRDIDLTHSEELMGKVFSSLFALFFLLFTVASSLFWQTLLLDFSYSCKQPNDDFVECFEYNLKENFHFWKAFARLGDDPIDCSSAKFQNGTVGVICYQIVFNIGAASGASYGGFKLSMIAVNAATGLMMLHKRPRSVTRTRIIAGFLMTAIYAAFLAFEIVESDKGSTNLIVRLDSRSLVIYLQLVTGFFAGFSFVFYIPWKDLVSFQNHLDLYDPIV